MLIKKLNGTIEETSERIIMEEIRIGNDLYYKPIGSEVVTAKWPHLEGNLVVREEGGEAFVCKVNVIAENTAVYRVKTGQMWGRSGGDTKYRIVSQSDGKAVVCAMDKDNKLIGKIK